VEDGLFDDDSDPKKPPVVRLIENWRHPGGQPRAASRGTYRVIIRHGVRRVRSGQRQTLGIIRDAR
jgi:hypothetical protein